MCAAVAAGLDVSVVGSPGWWMQRLAGRLAFERSRFQGFADYVRGEPPLPLGAENAREAYQQFLRMSRTNYAELISEAVRDRLRVTGFRSGASGTVRSDAESWGIWQANGLDVGSMMVHQMACEMGEAYAIVGEPDEETGEPTVTVEDPRECITSHDPLNRRRVRAALKVFEDVELGESRAYLYLRGAVGGRAQVFVASGPTTATSGLSSALSLEQVPQTWSWVSVGDLGDLEPQLLPMRAVPVVKFASRPNKWVRGRAEIEGHTDLLDRINTLLLQRVVTTVMQAFKQRAIKGDLPETDADGNRVDYDKVFTADAAALWRLPDMVELWESSPVDLTPMLSGEKQDLINLAAVTRTPLHYLTADGANQTAEGASLAREGRDAKVLDRMATLSESWEQVMALAFAWKGNAERARVQDMETLWVPAAEPSLTERGAAAVAAQTSGVPWRTIMTDVWGFSPQQVERMQAEREQDLLFAPETPGGQAPGTGGAGVTPPARTDLVNA